MKSLRHPLSHDLLNRSVADVELVKFVQLGQRPMVVDSYVSAIAPTFDAASAPVALQTLSPEKIAWEHVMFANILHCPHPPAPSPNIGRRGVRGSKSLSQCWERDLG